MGASFEDIKERLDQIVQAVSDDDLPIDKALTLYEEAVGLGLEASSLLERDILDEEGKEEGSDVGPDAPTGASRTQDAG